MTDPLWRANATMTKATGNSSSSATGNLASTTVGDLNVLWINVSPTGNGTDPGPITVGGVAVAAKGSTNSAGWTTLANSFDTGNPSVRLCGVFRIFQSGDPSTITWGFAVSTCNYVTGGTAWQVGTFDPADPVPSGSAAIQTQASSSTSFAAPSITTTSRGVICSATGNRTNNTYTAPSGMTIRQTDFNSSTANLAIADTGTAVAAQTVTKTWTGTGATSVANTAAWLIKENVLTPVSATRATTWNVAAQVSATRATTCAATPRSTRR